MRLLDRAGIASKYGISLAAAEAIMRRIPEGQDRGVPPAALTTAAVGASRARTG